MRRNRSIAVLAAALVASILVASPAPASGPPDLFVGHGAERAVAPSGSLRARSATVAVDLETANGPLTVQVNPFDDRSLPVVLHRADDPSGVVVWTGAVPGRPDTLVTIAVDDGWLFGSVHLGADGEFALRATGPGTFDILEVDPVPVGDSPDAAQVPPAPSDRSAPTPLADGGAATVDIMIVMSDETIARFGGGESEARVWAAARIAEINAILASSEMAMRVRLTGGFSVVYDQSSPADLGTDLDNLTFLAGEDCNGVPNCDPTGKLDQVHGYRDDFGADVVLLVVDHPGTTGGSGIGWLVCTPHAVPGSTCSGDYAFAVADFDAADTFYTLAHEFGHLLGSVHDAANDAENQGPTYARGYRVAGSFATVVAYVCTFDTEGACVPGTYADRVPYYSNPDVLYMGVTPMGKPIGDPAEADNATHFDEISPFVAAYRSQALCDGKPVTIFGSPFADTLTGTAGDDVIMGFGGADTIDGGLGNDTICGGNGDDILHGDEGNDRLFGDAGADEVYGDDGIDYLRGGNGVDTLYGGTGKDRLRGDAQNDILYGDTADDRLFGGPGDDDLFGEGGEDRLRGGGGTDTLDGGPPDPGDDCIGETESNCEI